MAMYMTGWQKGMCITKKSHLSLDQLKCILNCKNRTYHFLQHNVLLFLQVKELLKKKNKTKQ